MIKNQNGWRLIQSRRLPFLGLRGSGCHFTLYLLFRALAQWPDSSPPPAQFISLFLYVHVFLSVDRVRADCGQLDMGVGNGTWVIYKKSQVLRA